MKLCWMYMLTICAFACGGSQAQSSTPTAPSKPQQLTIIVDSSQTTNNGRPLHVMVRAVALKTYLQDLYSTVADKVVTPDDSVIGATVVYPGYINELRVDKPAKDSVAVYFMFTEPGASWKTYIEQPLPTVAKLVLGDNTIVQTTPITVEEAQSLTKKSMPKRRKFALASGAVGAAGLLNGTVFGLLANRKFSGTSQYCDALNQCSAQGIAIGNQAKTLGTVANISFAVGAVGIGVGAVLWFTTPSSSSSSSTSSTAYIVPFIGSNEAGVTVRMRF